MGEKVKETKGAHFSTIFVERAGKNLIDKKCFSGRRIDYFPSSSVVFEKTDSEIERDFRVAFKRIKIWK